MFYSQIDNFKINTEPGGFPAILNYIHNERIIKKPYKR